MVRKIMQDRNARVIEAAARLGVTVADSGEKNVWAVAVTGKPVGSIRFSPRAGVWLATTGIESTAGELAGCLKFMICRC